MQVRLQVMGHLREYFPRYAEPAAVEVAEPATVRAALLAAGIPPELPGSVLVGGMRVRPEHLLAAGDTLQVLSPMAGG